MIHTRLFLIVFFKVEDLRDEAARALEETAKHTRNTQRAVTTRLDQRVQKVDHWQGEIEHKLHELNNEIDTLLNLKVSFWSSV